jgi:hypothetical protein
MDTAYEIKFVHHPEYLYTHVSAEGLTLHTSHDLWAEVAAELRLVSFNKVFFSVDISKQGNLLDVFQAASGLSGMGFGGVRIAFVNPNPTHYNNTKFAEIVGDNKEIYGKIFQDACEAKSWLLKT